MNDRTELCLFLSSTFLDMGPEREYLMKHLFPELRQLCRERGVVLTEIDLRWGITERQARRGKIVTACLDEILHRRPLILAFIGDRYGWRPTLNDLKDTAFLEKHPWIERGVNEGKSLVELETLEVARNDPAMREHLRFYFKRKHYSPLQNGKGGGESSRNDPEDFRLLRDFQGRVRKAELPVREGYQTPARLGEWVREDVLAILNGLVSEVGDGDSWIARERYGHEAYAATRRRAYIDHTPTLQQLDDYVLPAHARAVSRVLPLVVTGESGAGKSALLARWSRRHRERFPEAFVVEHYVGATPSSADRFALMRRIMAEIRERYQFADELPTSPEQIVEAFPSWLARVREENLVLVVDALDRLENNTLALESFPRDYPPQVRLVLSTTSGPTLDQVHGRGWGVLDVHPLAEKDRGRVIRAYLAEFSKQLEPEQVRRIATDGKSANPLYLRTSLEELRLHGRHETLNRQIEHYLSATDSCSLFGLVLERIEKDFGKGLTSSVMSYLWASRSGLSESELSGLVQVSPPKLRPLIQGMEYHLTSIDGRLSFCHEHLRRAVEERYLPSRVRRRNFHRRIGAYFSTLPPSSRRAEEEPWQWRQGEEWKNLQACLTDPDLFTLLNGERLKFQLLEYWRIAQISGEMESAYLAALRQLGYHSNAAGAWESVGGFVMTAGHYDVAIRLFGEAVQSFETVAPPELPQLLDGLGAALTEMGNFAEAERYLQKSLELKKLRYHSEALEITNTLELIGNLFYHTQKFAEAEEIYEQMLHIRQKSLGVTSHATISGLGAVPAAAYGRRKFDKAEKLFAHQLEYLEASYGNAGSETATCLNNLAALMSQTGRHEAASRYFKRALEIYESIFGPYHPATAKALSNLSCTLLYLNNIVESEQLVRRAIDSDRKMLGEHHPTIALKLINLGTLLKDSGKPTEAEALYREAFEIREVCFGSDHIATTVAMLNIAGALKEQGRLEEALALYENYLPKKIAGLPREDAGLQRSIRQYKEIVEQLEMPVVVELADLL